jgi:hypothetical protein
MVDRVDSASALDCLDVMAKPLITTSINSGTTSTNPAPTIVSSANDQSSLYLTSPHSFMNLLSFLFFLNVFAFIVFASVVIALLFANLL